MFADDKIVVEGFTGQSCGNWPSRDRFWLCPLGSLAATDRIRGSEAHQFRRATIGNSLHFMDTYGTLGVYLHALIEN